MENESKQDFYWESPCEKCHYRKDSGSSSVWTSVLAGILVLVVAVAVYLWNGLNEAESKLQNCIYMDDNGRVHSVRNGQDSNMFDVDYLKNLFEDPFGDGFEIID